MVSVTSNGLEPQQIIPFKVTRAEFASDLIDEITIPDTPLDLYKKIPFNKASKIFVPMYRFSGTYSTTWKCEVERSAESIRKNPNNRYRVKNGQKRGEFSVLCCACSEDVLPEGLSDFISEVVANNKLSAKTFTEEMLGQGKNKNAKLLNADLEVQEAWISSGKDSVEEFAASESKRMAPSTDGFEADTKIKLAEEGSIVLVPFWYVEFSYNGETFYFIRSGFNYQCSTNDYPADEEIEATRNRLNSQKRNKVLLVGFLIPLVLAAIVWIFVSMIWIPIGIAVLGEIVFYYIWSNYIYFSTYNNDFDEKNDQVRSELAKEVLAKVKKD